MKVTALLAGATVWVAAAGSPQCAVAQVVCAMIPAGLARTDCYIGLSRVNRQRSEISAGVTQQQTDDAIYRKMTGKQEESASFGACSVSGSGLDNWLAP